MQMISGESHLFYHLHVTLLLLQMLLNQALTLQQLLLRAKEPQSTKSSWRSSRTK
jgi:hypothetical protein